MLHLHQAIDFVGLKRRMGELFGFSIIGSYTLIHGGYMSQNFRVETDQGPFFLKQYRNRLNHVVHEIKMAETFFAAQGLPVITPIQDRHGRDMFWFDGHWLSLFPFVDGISPAFGMIKSTTAKSLGALLGKFHLAGKRSPFHHFQHLHLWDQRKFLMEKIELEDVLNQKTHRTELDELILTVLKIKEELVNERILDSSAIPLPYDHLLHGDLIYQNTFMAPDSTISHVYDLEKTCIGPRAYELGRSLIINCFDDGLGDHQLSLARDFLQHYQSINPITYEEFSLGIRMYLVDLIHMTWIEAKYVIYGEKQQLELYRRHANRVLHMQEIMGNLADQIFPL